MLTCSTGRCRQRLPCHSSERVGRSRAGESDTREGDKRQDLTIDTAPRIYTRLYAGYAPYETCAIAPHLTQERAREGQGSIVACGTLASGFLVSGTEEPNANAELVSTVLERLMTIWSRVFAPREMAVRVESWLERTYERLSADWARFEIKIPAPRALFYDLKRVPAIVAELEAAEPRLHGRMSALLVPPSKEFGWPVSPRLRVRQGIPNPVDQVAAPRQVESVRRWRLLVADTSPSGIYLGSPNQIVEAKSYLVASRDTRALGPREYAALTLQVGDVCDRTTYTWLLRGWSSGAFAPTGRFYAGRFLFRSSDADYHWDLGRYRAAVEVASV